MITLAPDGVVWRCRRLMPRPKRRCRRRQFDGATNGYIDWIV